uniref:Uncharacterized protein n=1 Tax=Physcomitrium patens TaxID=3218 RepID=A0A2K1KN84_PHYPA|nr:hypothetical protein PHYPA_006135 [Physcomitrium patens]
MVWHRAVPVNAWRGRINHTSPCSALFVQEAPTNQFYTSFGSAALHNALGRGVFTTNLTIVGAGACGPWQSLL